MPTPKTEIEVRGFLRRVNYKARFISQLMATYNPTFKLLRKDQKMEWNQEYQEAFEKVKRYLETSLVLVSVVLGKPLILYLLVLEESMGCILGQRGASRKEQVIYYLSKKFMDCEQRYPALERTCYALVWTSKRLRQYMLAHTTWLIAKMDPLNLHQPESHKRECHSRAVATSSLGKPLTPMHEFPDEHIMSVEETGSKVKPNEWKL
ncbi:Retrovirus-related Pol polyprotein, partial [Mucuna pruriens]